MLKKKKGAALAAVLMVLVVLSILGAALLSISENENKMSINNERKMQAYYIARSGADAAAAWIEDPDNDASLIVPAAPSNGTYISQSTRVGEGSFTVSISRNTGDPTVIRVESNSVLDNGGVKGKAILLLKETAGYGGGQVFKDVIFGQSSVSFNGTVDTYGSDVETIGSIYKNGKIDHHGYSAITVTNKTYPQPVFPANLPKLAYNSSTGISSDGYYGSIKVSSGTLDFNTGGKDLKVMVDSLDIKNLRINGGGRVLLFVNQTLSVFGNGSNSNDCDDLFIFGKAGSQMSFSGNSSFSGFIFAPSSSVTIKGTPGFNGSIVAGDVSCSGGASIIYNNSGDSVSSIKPFIGTSFKRIGWSSN